MYSRKQMSMKNIPNTPSVHNIYINFHKTKKIDSENNLNFLGFSLYTGSSALRWYIFKFYNFWPQKTALKIFGKVKIIKA